MDDPNINAAFLAEEVLPCPFCGCTKIWIENLGSSDDWYCQCSKCEVQQIANYDRLTAISRWNQREGIDTSRYPMRASILGNLRERAEILRDHGSDEAKEMALAVLGLLSEQIIEIDENGKIKGDISVLKRQS